MSQQLQKHINEAIQALDETNYSLALEKIQEILELDPNSSDAYLLQGIALSQLDKNPEATLSFEKAIELNNKSPRAYYNFATHLYRTGGKQKALEMAQAALEIHPGYGSAKELIELIQQEQESQITPQEDTSKKISENTSDLTPEATQKPLIPVQDNSRPPLKRPFPFVRTMGARWIKIGWFLALANLALLVLNLSLILRRLSALPQKPTEEQVKALLKKLTEEHLYLFAITGTLLYLLKISILAWSTMDILHRRSNLLWFIPIVLSIYFSLEWVAAPFYILVGIPAANSKNKDS